MLQTTAPPSTLSHRRHRSGTIKAPILQSLKLTGALNGRVSAPALHGQRLQASPLPIKPASIPSFSSLPPSEQGAKAAQADPVHTPAASLGLHRGGAISSATSIASPAQVDTILNNLRNSTSYRHGFEERGALPHRRIAAQYCLLSFSKGMILEDSATLSSYRLRPFELLELQPLSIRHRVRLPRHLHRKSRVSRRDSVQDLTTYASNTSFSFAGASISAPLRTKDAVAPCPLLPCDYLDTFAHGWAYVYQLRGCPEKAGAVGLGCWKLRWLVVHQGRLCVFRRRPNAAKETVATRGREATVEKGEDKTMPKTASPQGLIGECNLAEVSWLNSELADGTTSPAMRTLAKDLINICFSKQSTLHAVGVQGPIGSASPHHIVSLRFLTDHAAHCWYSLFQRFHCRSQLARRGETLRLDELAKLRPHSNRNVCRSINTFLQQTETDVPCPWDASVKVSVDAWRKRAYLRSLVAGRGGVTLPGKSGRGGGRNAWTKTRISPTVSDIDAEDADLWSDHSEEEGVFTLKGEPFATIDTPTGAVFPGSLMQDLQEDPGDAVPQQRATSMEELLTTSASIAEEPGTPLRNRKSRPSTSGAGSRYHPCHQATVDMLGASWFFAPPPPPPPPPSQSASADSPYKALMVRRNSFANLAAAFVGGGRLSSSHGRRPTTGKKGASAPMRPEMTRLQTTSRASSVERAKASHESPFRPPAVSVVTRDVASGPLATPSLPAPIRISTRVPSTTSSRHQANAPCETHHEDCLAAKSLATNIIASDSQAASCSSHSSSSLTPRPQPPVLLPVSEPQSPPLPSAAPLLDTKGRKTETSIPRPSTPRVAGALSPLQTQGATDVVAAAGVEGSSKSPVLPPRSPYRTSSGRKGKTVEGEPAAVDSSVLDPVESESPERSLGRGNVDVVEAEPVVASILASVSSPADAQTAATSPASTSTPTPAIAAANLPPHDELSAATAATSASTSQRPDAPPTPVLPTPAPAAGASSHKAAGASPLTSPSSLRLEELTQQQQKKRGRGWSLSRFITKKG